MQRICLYHASSVLRLEFSYVNSTPYPRAKTSLIVNLFPLR